MSTTTEPRVKIIETTSRDDVRPGDHVIWEHAWTLYGVTRTVRLEGIAHHRYEGGSGDWFAEDGGMLTDGEGGDITIRRTVQELPTKPGTVLEPAEGHEYITATVAGKVYRAREAILLETCYWHAAWRSDEGVMTYVTPEHLDADTCKEGNR